MDDLVTWLRTQLDDDERVARAATSGPWHVDGCSVLHSGPSTSASNERWGHYIAPAVGAYDGDHPTDADAAHIARHDPARVLAEVEAKRRIMAIHNRRAEVFPNDAGGTFDNCCDGCGYEGICDDPVTENINDCPILRALALPHANQPGYRDERRPDLAS